MKLKIIFILCFAVFFVLIFWTYSIIKERNLNKIVFAETLKENIYLRLKSSALLDNNKADFTHLWNILDKCSDSISKQDKDFIERINSNYAVNPDSFLNNSDSKNLDSEIKKLIFLRNSMTHFFKDRGIVCGNNFFNMMESHFILKGNPIKGEIINLNKNIRIINITINDKKIPLNRIGYLYQFDNDTLGNHLLKVNVTFEDENGEGIQSINLNTEYQIIEEYGDLIQFPALEILNLMKHNPLVINTFLPENLLVIKYEGGEIRKFTNKAYVLIPTKTKSNLKVMQRMPNGDLKMIYSKFLLAQ